MEDDIIFDFSDSVSLDEIDIIEPKTLEASIPDTLQKLFDIQILSCRDIIPLAHKISAFRAFRGYDFYYRGHNKNSYELIPSIARGDYDIFKEEMVLNEFISRAEQADYPDFMPPNTDKTLYYMGIARHLGCYNRLLDWTSGIREALSFLLDESIDEDGDLWIMAVPRSFQREKCNPFNIVDSAIHLLVEEYYLPPNTSISQEPLGLQRRSNQNGIFSVTSSLLLRTPLNELPKESLNGIEFFRLTITKDLKKMIPSCSQLFQTTDWLYIRKEDGLIEYVNQLNYNLENEMYKNYKTKCTKFLFCSIKRGKSKNNFCPFLNSV